MSCKHLARLSVLLAVFMALLLPTADAGKGGGSTPLTLDLYDKVVDEQDTQTFYTAQGLTGDFCSTSELPFTQNSAFKGDQRLLGPAGGAYGGFGSSWSFVIDPSTEYAHNADCGNNCQRVQFDSNNKTLTFDTRGTLGPREVTVSFGLSCDLPGCPTPAGKTAITFDTQPAGTVTTSGLLNVFLDFPYTSMGTCDSAVCPQAQPAFAKFWFTDPGDPSVTWRIDWQFLRVLRMSSDTWYLIADGCDGSWIAGLSKLVGNRTRPKTVFNGYYLIPFFISVKLQ